VQQECTENSLQIEIINHVINVIKKLIATADKGKLPKLERNMKHISSEYLLSRKLKSVLFSSSKELVMMLGNPAGQTTHKHRCKH